MGNRVFDKLANRELLDSSPLFVFAADALASVGLHGLGEEGYPTRHFRRRDEFLQLMRQIARDGYVDALLMTPADAEVLAVEERLFEEIPVTPIVRMNAETNIWNPRHGQYRSDLSLPFQTVSVADARYCEKLMCSARDCHVGIGLYSITLNNDVSADARTLNAYLTFAAEVGKTPGFDHLLEVFLPNVNLPGMDDMARGQYVADSIVRTMSYLRKHQRPLFIKTEYTGREVWEELTRFDPTLVIGALGGPRRSARHTLQLAYDVTEYGGKVILFGRAVFTEESPRLIAKMLRAVLDRAKTPEEAHAEYQREVRVSRGL